MPVNHPRTIRCKECGQLSTYVIGALAQEVCPTCTSLPGWFSDAQLRETFYYDPLRCPNCDSADLTERMIADVFAYGIGAAAVQLVARVPLVQCACGLDFTDLRAEELREEAVRQHLEAK